MSDQLTKAASIAHTLSAQYQRRLAEAQEIIRKGLASCDPYVACSFGKDSAVILHMAMQERPDIEARFIRWPETDHLGNYDEVISMWEAIGARIKTLHLSRASLDEKVSGRWDALRDGAAGVIIGLRASESKARRTTLGIHGTVFRSKSGVWRISPLAWWTTQDVAAYIMQHNLPTLDTYKKHGFGARTASRIPRQQVRGEVLRRIKQENPAAFSSILEIYPDAAEWVYL